jgi:ribosomal protein L36
MAIGIVRTVECMGRLQGIVAVGVSTRRLKTIEMSYRERCAVPLRRRGREMVICISNQGSELFCPALSS